LKIYFKNKVIMKTSKSFKRFSLELFTGIFIITNIIPVWIVSASSKSTKIVYPVKEVSTLECRYTEFDELSSKCKQKLPILKTKDYTKYIKKNWGYNEYTRYYTVLWGASYKYGWDVWFGWHQWTDITSSRWTPIYSMADWKVIVAKKALGWGNVVTVEHFIEWKKVFSNYAHLDEISVKVWDKVTAWKIVWKMGSTWNSTWNHLHFQIDLDTPFHPYYYSRKTCPYSYHEITEKWVCFDDLKANTIDPLLFLETKWKILKNLKAPTKKVEKVKNPTRVFDPKKDYDKDGVTKKTNTPTYNSNISIFDKTVYVWYPKADVREVQQILRDLELYDGWLTWNYRDIENIIYKYQVKKGVVQNKSSIWAGRFGPKTRSTIKIDYDKFLKSGKKHNYVVVRDKKADSYNTVDNWIKTQKIERTHIMTREEIEAKEYENFIKNNDFNLDLKNVWWNIKIWNTSKIDFKITKKYRDKPFKGNTPLDISIVTDERVLKVFPKKFYNFSDWKREIKLTWAKSWVTNVQVKFWNKTIKTYKIRVYGPNEKIYLESWKIYGQSKVVLWDNVKGIALFEDKTKKRLINVKYNWTYKLKWIWDTKVCIKKWSIKNLSKVHKKSCNKTDYKNEIEFTYEDTIAWILLFDYKSTWKNAKVEIINTYNNAKLADKKLVVSNPKWLKSNYVYKSDVINVLKNDIATNSSKWYFLENRAITQYDANVWMRNTLNKVKSETYNANIKNRIDAKLKMLNKESSSKHKTLTRKEFLEKSYKYLVVNETNLNHLKTYKDLDSELNNKASALFDKNITWKDKFGENYFQPNKQITRWEVAFILNNTITNNTNTYLSVR